MELNKFQQFYSQILTLFEQELNIDKEKLSMILHSQVTEHTIDSLLSELKTLYKASSIELWFLEPTYNRYYLFDSSISIPHIFRSMTRSLSAFHFQSFFKNHFNANNRVATFKAKSSLIFSNQNPEDLIIAISIDESQSGVIFVFNPKKSLTDQETNPLIKQNTSLINTLIYTDDLDYSPYLILQPSININALKALQKLTDINTFLHEEKASKLAKAISGYFKFPSYTMDRIAIASKLHDIGKLLIPKNILSKGDNLTPEELKILQTHVTMGADILSLLGFSQDITKLVLEHHERLDGSGFPLKLKNYQLTLESQIIGIADELSVLVTRDTHHEKTSEATSIFELVQYKGIKYSGELIDTLEQMIKDKTLLPLLK